MHSRFSQFFALFDLDQIKFYFDLLIIYIFVVLLLLNIRNATFDFLSLIQVDRRRTMYNLWLPLIQGGANYVKRGRYVLLVVCLGAKFVLINVGYDCNCHGAPLACRVSLLMRN